MKIVISVAVALLLIACSEDTSSSKVQTKQVVEKNTTVVEPKVVIKKEVKKEIVVPEVKVEVKKPVVTKKVVQKPVAIATPKIDGASIFKKCSSCHGVNAEKKALNKSAVIQGWDTQKLIVAIKGYKDGTYGSTMKGVMKPQVANLGDEEIKAVSNYISGL